MRILTTLLLLTLVIASVAPPVGAQSTRPRLVVVLMVDQMRADYLEKYRPQWNRGLARLLDEGAWFRQADYPYANTVTCAGHASVSTGTLPAVHGMVMNTWWDRDLSRVVACADDASSTALSYGKAFTATGQSAARLLAPTLADEMRAQLAPSAKVAAFSLKARSAVTLGGQRPDAIAWVADEGAWVTSTAYPQAQVPAVARFIGANPVEHQLWTLWERAMPDSAYAFEERAVGMRGDDAGTFPHPVRTWDEWEASPLSDRYLGRMALSVASGMRFGEIGHTDYLAISFSALDLVGHTYGPNSHEVQDVLFQLDRTLGQLLDGLDALVGKDNYVVALTSDHGVGPTPERAEQFGFDAGRISARAIPDAVQTAVAAVLGRGRWTGRLMNGDLYLDDGVFDRLRATPDGIERLRAALIGVPGVDRVYSRDELARVSAASDPMLRQLANSYVSARSGDFAIVFKPYWLVGGGNGASHGTPYHYDTHVPVLLAGSGIIPGEFSRPVTPLDIAPTLAYLTGITLSRAQGQVLVEALSTAPYVGAPRRLPKQR